MKIQNLRLERCGGWQNLTLPLASDGLTVLYGPNETGKSTVMRFIRGVLFGFEPEDERGPGARPRRLGCAGELIVHHEEREYTIRRESDPDGRERVYVTTAGAVLDADQAISRLCGGLSRDVFEHVFAVGLPELQQIASLQGADVARMVYEMSLGRKGELVVQAWRRTDAARHELWDAQSRTGKLARLSSAIDAVGERLQRQEEADAHYLDLRRAQQRIGAEMEDMRSRQRGLHEQLRGHEFMALVWGPWRRRQSLESELAALRPAAAFPEGGLDRLDALDSELADLRRRRRQLQDQARRIRESVDGIRIDREVDRHRAALARLAERWGEARAAESRLTAGREKLVAARKQLDAGLAQLGTGWDEARLERLDVSPAAGRELFHRAQVYRDALRNRSRRIRRYQRWSAEFQRSQSEHAATFRLDGRTFDEGREDLLKRISLLEEVERLQAQAALRSEGVEALQEQLRSTESPRPLPPYFYSVLSLFGLAGLCLLLIGVWRAVEGLVIGSQWVVGLIFALLGISGAGLTWTMKRQFDPAGDAARSLRGRLARAEDELADARRDLAQAAQELRLRTDAPAGRVQAGDFGRLQAGELLRAARDELSRFDLARERQAACERRRDQLATLRGRIRDLQRAVSDARRQWCKTLKSIGLDESLQLQGSLKAWEAAQEARLHLAAWRSAQEDLTSDEGILDAFRNEVTALAGELTGRHDIGDPHACLAEWIGRLENSKAARSRLRGAQRELRACRGAWRESQRAYRPLQRQRRALLREAGATSRDAFLERLQLHHRYLEVRRQLDTARADLAAAAQTQPELAVVEDDLLQFDPEQNKRAIDTLRSELSDLEQDLHAAHERLGEVKHEVQSREADRTAVELRFDLAQLQEEWDGAVLRWSAIELVQERLEMLRSRLERDCQPETLDRASRYLRALTAGRYGRVWMPLGERRLVVDDDRQQSLRVEQLSSGAREQLFLAIRLALIDRLREQGIELPVILDDVLVNFDQLRTEAAIDTLVEYARSGRQVVMFTCHLHLAAMCEDTGVRTLRLPDAGAQWPERRVG